MLFLAKSIDEEILYLDMYISCRNQGDSVHWDPETAITDNTTKNNYDLRCFWHRFPDSLPAKLRKPKALELPMFRTTLMTVNAHHKHRGNEFWHRNDHRIGGLFTGQGGGMAVAL